MAHLPHSKALRKGRYSAPGQIHLITTCSHNRCCIFNNLDLAYLVINEILQSANNNLTRTIAYVVMPDHMHWLLELQASNNLSMAVGRIKGKSAFHINKMRGQSRRVWKHGFHDHAVRQEENLQVLGDYIIHNPVRARIVQHIDDYPLWGANWLPRGIGK